MSEFASTTTLPDYRFDPEAYEVEEKSRPDEMRMFARLAAALARQLESRGPSSVLDLCCGTGLSMAGAVRSPVACDIVGVDICEEYLEYAASKVEDGRQKVRLIHGDAITAPLPDDRWNIIILSSAYHHIEDARKADFLLRVRDLMAPGGSVLVAENLLPEYEKGNGDDYRRATRQFYSAVLETAKQADAFLDPHVEGLIRRVAQYGCDGDYEYKSSWSVFMRDIHFAGFGIVRCERVWPDDELGLGGTGGNYVLEMKPLCPTDP
jgi:ubiquinone/menaquinone biosynthesis C-methylase UbiE